MCPRPALCTPTATCPAASTTRRRPASRPSRSRASWRSTTTPTTSAFKTRAIIIKEERAELVKHHLWVLWTDYFKPEHLEKYPQLHDLFWKATKKAGEAKKTTDVAVANDLLAQIAEIDKIFWETKK